METIHHAIMSKRWASEHGCSDDTIEDILFWSMIPDLIPGVHGYHLRSFLHLEDDESILGSQLHHTSFDLSRIYITPLIPVLPKTPCAARTGILLHLIQDSSYDSWISRFVGVEKKNDSWAYYRKDNKKIITSADVTRLKIWAWRCGWLEEISDELSEDEKAGKSFPQFLQQEYIEPIKKNMYWDVAYEAGLKERWKSEMQQESPPYVLLDREEDMLSGLRYAWRSWQERIS